MRPARLDVPGGLSIWVKIVEQSLQATRGERCEAGATMLSVQSVVLPSTHRRSFFELGQGTFSQEPVASFDHPFTASQRRWNWPERDADQASIVARLL